MTQAIPPGWYPDPSGAPGTRYWDGTRWAAAQPTARKRLVWPWILLAVFVLFFGGCGALVMLGAAAGNHAKTDQTSASAPPRSGTAAPIAPPSTTTPEAKAAPSITYQVDSDGTLSTVTYFDGMNDQKQVTDVSAPWSLTFENQATFPMIGVGAQTTGLHVSCQISINGQVRDQKTATGRYAVVNCSAHV